MMQARDVGAATGPSGGIRKQRKSRGRGLRTTTGCAICRKRHMKCDEVKPICGPCSKGDRPCVYGTLPADSVSTSENENPFGSPSRPIPQQQGSRSSHKESDAQIQTQTSQIQWPATSTMEDPIYNKSPQSTYSSSTGYGTEVAPLRWFGLLAGDAANSSLDLPSLETLSDAALAERYQLHPDGVTAAQLPVIGQLHAGSMEAVTLQNPSKLLQISALSPVPVNGVGTSIDERTFWQAPEPIQLKDHEFYMFQRFVTGVSLWIDLFDPLKHFSSFVPHLAMQNEGLMKAILALGARHMSIKPLNSGEANIDRTSAVQYYYETLQYLQSAMRFTSYKNSLELLATVLVVSTYEMIDGAGKGWERHLKGVFWIQRSRDINGESGGLEQAIWWAWLRQDVWAAFREHRRCFSFFKPTKPYQAMDVWDMASRIVYILAQSVNYSSDEEKHVGERDLNARIHRANTLLNMLDEWKGNITVHFDALPIRDQSNHGIRPIWIHPSAFGTSIQMYCMARILLLIHQPAAGGYMEYRRRDVIITECIDTIVGIALKLTDDASRLMSTQCLWAAGMYADPWLRQVSEITADGFRQHSRYCADPDKRKCITELITDHSMHTGWPSNTDLAKELQTEWSK